jgi:hypothetical protein
MDNNDEMMMELMMQDEADTAIDDQQWMMLLAALLCSAIESSSSPNLVGVVQGLGRRRTRIGSDLQVPFCLTLIIFADDATNTPKEFQFHFCMYKKLFMKNVIGV